MLEGLALANPMFSTTYVVSRIQYRIGDNPPEGIYVLLMMKLVEHRASGGEFREEDDRQP